MEDRVIGMIAASTNIEPSDIRYEISVLEFSDRLFDAMRKAGVNAYLFGGTALNKGFFGEKQRLSKDLDLEIGSNGSFARAAHDIESCMVRAGYPNIRTEEHKGRFTVYVFLDDSIGELKVDIVPQQNSVKAVTITLHSILEYVGIPTKSVQIRSYPFEYLLAYKLYALHRRMLYKDIYDSYTGLQLQFDRNKLLRYLGMFGRTGETLKEIIYNIENGEYDKRDELGYEKLVQEKYKVPLKNMLYEIQARLSSLQTHNKIKNKADKQEDSS